MPKFELAFALQRCTGEIYPEDLNCLPDDLKKVPTLPNVGIYLSLACEIENGAEQRSQEVVKFLWSPLRALWDLSCPQASSSGRLNS